MVNDSVETGGGGSEGDGSEGDGRARDDDVDDDDDDGGDGSGGRDVRKSSGGILRKRLKAASPRGGIDNEESEQRNIARGTHIKG